MCNTCNMKCSKCGAPADTFRDKAHKHPSSYCKKCNNKEMRLRRQFRRGTHDSLWMQKDRATNEKRYASRPCPKACEVCGATPTKVGRRPLDFDHCHWEGLFRGWLCHSCNMAL